MKVVILPEEWNIGCLYEALEETIPTSSIKKNLLLKIHIFHFLNGNPEKSLVPYKEINVSRADHFTDGSK